MLPPPNPAELAGPPPFRFAPHGGAVEGPAFSPLFKALATAIVLGSAVWLLLLWSRGVFGDGRGAGLAWFGAALALMLYTWWNILTSRTRLDPAGLHQRWVWNKDLELRELAYARLIRVRGLDWLIAPRLYARTLLGKFAVFYTASPEVLAEFERLVRELQAFRRP